MDAAHIGRFFARCANCDLVIVLGEVLEDYPEDAGCAVVFSLALGKMAAGSTLYALQGKTISPSSRRTSLTRVSGQMTSGRG